MTRRFWKQISRSVPANIESLCAFRVLIGLFLLVIYMPHFMWLGSIPRAFFRPPLLSLANFSNDFPNKYFLVGIDIGVLASAVCLTIGIRARLAARVFVILNLIGLSYQYSLGKIDHSILLYCLLGIMSFSNWGTRLCLVPDKLKDAVADQKALSLFAVVLCFAFFTAVFEKAVHWVNFDFNTSGTANWIYSGYFALDRRYLLASVAKSLPFGVFKLFDYCAVVLELSPLIMLLRSRRAWSVWLLAACVFHLINTVFLNIPFIFNGIVYLVFCNFSSLYQRIAAVRLRSVTGVVAPVALIAIVAIGLTTILSGGFASNLFFPAMSIKANLYLASGVWIAASGVLLRNVVQKFTVQHAPIALDGFS